VQIGIPSHHLSDIPNGRAFNLRVVATDKVSAEGLARAFAKAFQVPQEPECCLPALKAIYEEYKAQPR
jgi:hypothetical protein